ncbi:MAG: DUF6320 domain-containing protein [Spirochaetes bacterium]|nr:DUF6320 domain-containing protein [Spirochaetota bacterium]
MSYCPDCGVEIGTAPACPLCDAKNPKVQAKAEMECDEETGARAASADFLGAASKSEHFTPQESRKIVWEVLSVAFSIAIGSLLAINILVAGRLTWSLYPVATFVFIWVVSTSFLVMRRAPKLRLLLAAAAPLLYLLALGAFTGDFSWAWRLAVPIAIFSEIVCSGIALMILGAKRKGLNIFAYALVGVALICVGVEIFVDLYFHGVIRLTWSAITALALIPIASFLHSWVNAVY